MGGAFSSDDNENDNVENAQMLNKSVHRGGSNQRRGKNKNTTSKNKPKKSVSFFSDYYENNNENDNDNDNDNNETPDNDSPDNDLDVMEPIAKKRKPRKQSANTTKKRRYN
jgi:hypothetical protein